MNQQIFDQAEQHLIGYDAVKQTGDGNAFRGIDYPKIGSIAKVKFGTLTGDIPCIIGGIHQYNGRTKYDLTLFMLMEDAWHETRIYNVDSPFVSFKVSSNKKEYKNEKWDLDKVEQMCIESLSPEVFEMWETVRRQLHANRGI